MYESFECQHLWYKETKSKAGLVVKVAAYCKKGMGPPWTGAGRMPEIDPEKTCSPQCKQYARKFSISRLLAKPWVRIALNSGQATYEDVLAAHEQGSVQYEAALEVYGNSFEEEEGDEG